MPLRGLVKRSVCHLEQDLMIPGNKSEAVHLILKNSTHCAHVSINGCNSLVCPSLQKLACDDLLDSKNNTILASDTNRSSPVLYRLDRVFDLEISAIWGED